MTKWEDTVMSNKDLEEMPWRVYPDTTTRPYITQRLRTIAEAQAEISFKMGEEHGIAIAKKNYLLGRSCGRRETMEWVEKLQRTYVYETCVDGEEWQAQKKEWGI